MQKNVLVALVAGMLAVVPMHGQMTLGYDVVSVKPNKTGGGMIRVNQGSDMYAGTNVTLKMLLRYAYDLTTEDQISGLSGQLASAHFDIEAKMDAETVAAIKKMSKEESNAARRKMMQDMLVERFQLKMHHEQKELGMYDLVIAKSGVKLQPAAEVEGAPKDADGKPQPKGSMMVRNGQLTGEGIPVSNLAMFLAQMLHKQVVDKTGLKGNYDMSLKWQPEEQAPESHDATGGEQAPSIFTAVQEQLGLKLEPTKGLVDTIVVDHVEVPSENSAMRLSVGLVMLVGAASAMGQAALTYDVVSIRPNTSASGDSSWGTADDGYRGTNVTVRSMIRDAYHLPTADLIRGLPGWADSMRFDVQAKLDEEAIATLKAESKKEKEKSEEGMLRALLAERFGLTVHPEKKEAQVYELVATRVGEKLKATDPASGQGGSINFTNQSLTAIGAAMENFCNFLSDHLHRRVDDKTGLGGRYDFTLQWTPDEAAGESVAATGATQLPSIFGALQEQLGLKLEAVKGLVDTIVVDHIQMPSEN